MSDRVTCPRCGKTYSSDSHHWGLVRSCQGEITVSYYCSCSCGTVWYTLDTVLKEIKTQEIKTQEIMVMDKRGNKFLSEGILQVKDEAKEEKEEK